MKEKLFWKLTLAPSWIQKKYPKFVSNWIHKHMGMCEQDWCYIP